MIQSEQLPPLLSAQVFWDFYGEMKEGRNLRLSNLKPLRTVPLLVMDSVLWAHQLEKILIRLVHALIQGCLRLIWGAQVTLLKDLMEAFKAWRPHCVPKYKDWDDQGPVCIFCWTPFMYFFTYCMTMNMYRQLILYNLPFCAPLLM